MAWKQQKIWKLMSLRFNLQKKGRGQNLEAKSRKFISCHIQKQESEAQYSKWFTVLHKSKPIWKGMASTTTSIIVLQKELHYGNEWHGSNKKFEDWWVLEEEHDINIIMPRSYSNFFLRQIHHKSQYKQHSEPTKITTKFTISIYNHHIFTNTQNGKPKTSIGSSLKKSPKQKNKKNKK